MYGVGTEHQPVARVAAVLPWVIVAGRPAIRHLVHARGCQGVHWVHHAHLYSPERETEREREKEREKRECVPHSSQPF